MIALTWEDWEYRIDPSIVPLARLKKIRAMQAGNSLDAVLRLWQAAALLPVSRAAESSRAAADADALEQVRRAATSLRPLMETIREPNPPTDGTRNDGPNVKATLKEIVTALDAIRDARNLSRVPDLSQRLMKAVDVLTADVLLSLLYAVHIGDPDSPLWLQGDVAFRHDFGLQNRDSLDPDLLSWSFSVEQLGTTWHVRGSLLGLDIGLARLRLPQVATGGPPAPPVMAPEDQRVFIETVTLFGPAHGGDEAMHGVGDAIRAGRQRVTAAARNPEAIDRLAAIGHLGEWRRHFVLPWLTANTPADVLHAFSLTELYWIGLAGLVSAPAGADAWGTSAFPVSGCLCLRIPSPQAWEDVSGRISAVPPLMSDGTLRLAELMSELKLPAVLARHLMPVLMRGIPRSSADGLQRRLDGGRTILGGRAARPRGRCHGATDRGRPAAHGRGAASAMKTSRVACVIVGCRCDHLVRRRRAGTERSGASIDRARRAHERELSRRSDHVASNREPIDDGSHAG